MSRWTLNTWHISALFLLIGFVVYGASLRNGFLLWDDAFLIEHNALLRSINPTTIYQAFTTFDPELYIPLTFLSYQIDWMLGGGAPFFFHCTSLLLHVLNAILVMRIVTKISENAYAGYAAGLIFLLHPLNTEAVVWASARKDLLSSMFFLLSFWLFLLYRERDERRMYVLSLIAFLFALLSKVTAMMLPVLLLLLDELQNRPRSLRRYREYIPFVLLSGIFGVVAVLGKQQVLTTIPQWVLPFFLLREIGLTIYHAIIPLHLSILYPEDNPLNVWNAATIAGGLCTAACAASVWFFRKRSPMVAFGIGMFLLCMLPTFATFAKAGYVNVTSDRYAYLPLIGLLLATLSPFSRVMHAKNARALGTGIAGICLILGILTYRQAATWRDNKTLFEHAIAMYPSSPVLLTNLGVMAMNDGNYEEAERQFAAALKDGTYANAATNLGKLWLRKGDVERAEEEFRRASVMDPRDPESEFALGSLLANAGRDPEAITAFREALHRNPLHSPSLNNLAALLLKNGRTDEAIPLFEKLLHNSPYYSDAWFNYGLALQSAGRTSDAASAFAKALHAQPAEPSILKATTEAFIADGNISDAITALRNAMEQEPGNATNASLALETAKRILANNQSATEATALLQWMLAKGIIKSR